MKKNNDFLSLLALLSDAVSFPILVHLMKSDLDVYLETTDKEFKQKLLSKIEMDCGMFMMKMQKEREPTTYKEDYEEDEDEDNEEISKPNSVEDVDNMLDRILEKKKRSNL